MTKTDFCVNNVSGWLYYMFYKRLVFRLSKTQGFSQMELVITIAVIGIFFLAAVSSFMNIGRGLFVSKSRTLATNLAQEKIESLKNISYYRLIPTSSDDLNDYGYDNTYYAPEQLLVGDISFIRRVLVSKVTEDENGDIATVVANSQDTGLKQIKVTILWNDAGQQRTLELTNLRENPSRIGLNGTITGMVTEGFNGNPIYQADVMVSENQNYSATTDTNGEFSFKITTGTYRLQVSHRSYFPAVDGPFTVETGDTVDRTISLTKKSSGTVVGYAYINEHLIISMVMSGTTMSDDVELVELYNPTPNPITIGSTYFFLRYIDQANSIYISTLTWFSDPLTIPMHAYCLMSSTNPMYGEYKYWPTGSYALTPDIMFYPGSLSNIKHGIAITNQYGVCYDSVGWSPSGQSAPTQGRETTGVTCGGSGFESGACLLRWTYYDSGAALSSSWSNAMDTNNNSKDLYYFSNAAGGGRPYRCPRTISTIMAPMAGYPAVGAICYCDDGLSNAAVASASGYYNAARFNLTNIATGYWTVTISSGNWFIDFKATVTASGVKDAGRVLLTSACVDGFICGTVYSAISFSGSGISNILVKAGIYDDTTDSNGNFRISVPTGSYYVIANYNNDNPNYIEVTTAESMTVSQPGEVVTISPYSSPYYFNLKSGGGLTGRVVISNGTDPLPGVSVLVYGAGESAPYATALTDSDGNYAILNLCTTKNDHIVRLQLDSGESSNPTSVTKTVLSGQNVEVTTFVVTSAYGEIAGTVKYSGSAIKTGVLVLATTTSISGDPPEIGGTTDLYYSVTSDSSGEYSLDVRGGYTYYVYAWYVDAVSDNSVSYTKKTVSSVAVTAGETSTADFDWP